MTLGSIAHPPLARRERLAALTHRDRAGVWARSRVEAWVVAALVALAFGLRLHGIHQSLFGDDVLFLRIVDDHSLGEVLSLVRNGEETPPLSFLVGWALALGNPAAVLVRLPSLVASVATIPLVYLVGRRTVGGAAGVVAAAWLALSPFAIVFGTQARPYAQVEALVLASTLALLAALESRKRAPWVAYGLTTALAAYTHYTALFVLVPQAAWALWTRRDRVRPLLVANGLAAVAFLPWLSSFLVHAQHGGGEAKLIDQLAPLTPSNVAHVWAQALVGHPYVALGDLPGWPALAAVAASVGGLLLTAAVQRRGLAPATTLAGGRVLVVLLALAPIAAVVLYSVRPDHSLLLARNLSVAVPYTVLVIGWVMTRARSRLAAPLTALALLALLAGTVKSLRSGYEVPDASAAAEYIEANAPPAAPVVDLGGAHDIGVYLGPTRRVYTRSEYGRAGWAAAARAQRPVFVFFPRQGAIAHGFGPPRAYSARFRRVADRTWPGAPAPVGVQEYVPR